MALYSFGRIEPATLVTGHLRLSVLDTGTDNVVGSIEFSVDDLVPVLIEMFTAYEIEPTPLRNVVPDEHMHLLQQFPAQFPGVKVRFDIQTDQFVACARDGDLGVEVMGFGNCAGEAVGDLARNFGFKSKLPDGGNATLAQWFVDLAYGFKRISDETLQAEMDVMYAPDKGAW